MESILIFQQSKINHLFQAFQKSLISPNNDNTKILSHNIDYERMIVFLINNVISF